MLVKLYKYLSIWAMLIRLNIIKKMSYRANFVLTIIDSLVWFGITLTFFEVVYLHTNAIEGWSQREILVLVCVSEFIKSILFTFLIDGMVRIPRYINSADLDAHLLKPINARYLLSVREFDVGNLANLIPATMLFIYAVSGPEININPYNVLMFVIVLVLGVFACYSAWFMFISLSFWVKKDSEVNEMFLSILTLMKYPREIYKGAVGFVFSFVIPVVLASNVPVKVLTGSVSSADVLPLVGVTVIIFCCSEAIWRVGLRRYESASI